MDYSKLQDEIRELDSEYVKTEADIRSIKADIESKQEELKNLNNKSNRQREEEARRQLESAKMTKTADLQNRVMWYTNEIHNLEKQKQEKVNNINPEEFKQQFSQEYDIKEMVQTEMEHLSESANYVFGKRLTKQIYKGIDNMSFPFKYRSLEEIGERCQYLSYRIDKLSAHKSADVTGVVVAMTRKLDYKAEGNTAIIIMVILLVVFVAFYKYVAPIYFLLSLFIAVIYLRNTAEILSVIFEAKTIAENIDEIIGKFDQTIDDKYEERKSRITSKYNDAIAQYKNQIKETKKEIVRDERIIEDNFVPDYSAIEQSIRTVRANIQSSLESSNNQIKELTNKLITIDSSINTKKKQLIQALEDTINSWFNYKVDSNKTIIMPKKVPYTIKETEGEYELKYFEIPRGNALFVYPRDDYEYALDFAYNLISGLSMNMNPGSILADFIETKRNASKFRALCKVEQAYKANVSEEVTKERLIKDMKDLVLSRDDDFELRENTIDKYNQIKLEEDSLTLPYKMLFVFDSEDVIKLVTENATGNTSLDLGVYTYFFMTYEDLIAQESLEMIKEIRYIKRMNKEKEFCNWSSMGIKRYIEDGLNTKR